MPLASGHVDTTVVAAFAVGLVSFVSPCVLPLVPGYLSAISGVSFAELAEGHRRAEVLGPSLLFCLSFGVMFVALGMSATGLGQTLSDNRDVLRQIAGVVIIAMGVLFVGTLFVPRLNREWRPESLLKRASTGGPIVAGLAFAIAWLPCTGPTLGAILTAASTESSTPSTPSSGASGTVGTLPITIRPVSSSLSTRSVNVPPTSTAILFGMAPL